MSSPGLAPNMPSDASEASLDSGRLERRFVLIDPPVAIILTDSEACSSGSDGNGQSEFSCAVYAKKPHGSPTARLQSRAGGDTLDESGGHGEAKKGSAAGEAGAPALTDEQREVLRLVSNGQNVFFTGNAGTGKSFLLNQIIASLRTQYESDFTDAVAVTAATGIAATHIGGTTLHSQCGVGIPRVYRDFDKVQGKNAAPRWARLKVLIIDEVSMVSAEMFQELEKQARKVMHRDEPFGGIQLILSGDFFQLPPIEEKCKPGMSPECFLNRGFTFQAPAWRQCCLREVLLTRVFRQADSHFVRILDNIRYGRYGDGPIEELTKKCLRTLPEIQGVRPTQLFSRNADVNRVNIEEMQALTTPEVSICGCEGVDVDIAAGRSLGERIALSSSRRTELEMQLKRNEFFRDCLAPSTLQLKVGAQVMLLRNLDLTKGAKDMLVNGSRGVVEGFQSKAEAVQALRLELLTIRGRLGIAPDRTPRAAPSPTQSNPSQNAGDSGETASGFEDGSLAQLVKMDSLQRHLTIYDQWPGSHVPLVRFVGGRLVVCHPERFTAIVAGVGVCWRDQCPIKAAWAITCHKAQGMSLDRINISLKNMFAEGQAYVAVSRARSLEGLQIIGASPGCVKTSAIVQKFYEAMETGQLYCDTQWDQWQKERKSPTFGAASSQAGGAVYGSTTTTSGRGSGGGGSTQCFKCKGEGHWARDCPISAPAGRGRGGQYGGRGASDSGRGRGSYGRSSASGGWGSQHSAGAPAGGGTKRPASGLLQGSGRGRGAVQGVTASAMHTFLQPKNSSGRGGGRSTDTCYKCQKQGHWASNCPGR